MTFVRVKLQNGDEATVGEKAVAVFGATVIDKPAVDANGRPLEAKPYTTKGGTTKAASNQKEG